MNELITYLRCENDHANSVPLRDRQTRIGTPCSTCRKPLLAEPERERPPMRPRY